MAATITHSCYLLLALLMLLAGADCTTFTITNNCPYTVWPATLTNPEQQLSTTGLELTSHQSTSITASAPWSGRIWGRSGCSTDSSGRFSCTTADCGSGQVTCNGASGVPPATLVELTLGGQDFYDISNVDGFNLPVSVTPQGGSGACTPVSCSANLNDGCPDGSAVKGSDGSTIACRNANPDYFNQKCPQAYSFPSDNTKNMECTNPSGYQITFCP